VVDCPECKVKVAAELKGSASQDGYSEEAGGPYGNRLLVGICPRCNTLVAAETHQTAFAQFDSDRDEWSDCVRIYPNPVRTFSSSHIPRLVTSSLAEADKSLQAGAYTAACVMFGRALEALCRDLLEPKSPAPSNPTKAPAASPPPATAPTPATAPIIATAPAPATAPAAAAATKPRKIMLAEGIRQLKDKKFIDERLYDWSQQLHAFRNLAAHPEDVAISRQDAEDLRTFVYAIVEYIYDLTDRYEEFKARIAARKKP